MMQRQNPQTLGQRPAKPRAKYNPDYSKLTKIPLPEQTDLPEEVKACFYTIETLPKGGGIETSRCSPQSLAASSSKSNYTPRSEAKSEDTRTLSIKSRESPGENLTVDSPPTHISSIPSPKMHGLSSSIYATPSPSPLAGKNNNCIPYKTTRQECKSKPMTTPSEISHEHKMEHYIPPHQRSLQKNDKIGEGKSNENIPLQLSAQQQTQSNARANPAAFLKNNKVQEQRSEPLVAPSKTVEYIPPHLRWMKSSTNSSPAAPAERDSPMVTGKEHNGGLHTYTSDRGSFIPSSGVHLHVQTDIPAVEFKGGAAVINIKDQKTSLRPVQMAHSFHGNSGNALDTIRTKENNNTRQNQSPCLNSTADHYKIVRQVDCGNRPPPIPYSTKPAPGMSKPYKCVAIDPEEATRSIDCNTPYVESQKCETPGLEYPTAIHAAIMDDISASGGHNAAQQLTREALIQITGAAPPESVKSGLSKAISDDGVQEVANLKPQPSGDARGLLANPNHLVDWTGGWAPLPVVWETEREGFSSAFIPEYIKSWQKQLPEEIVSVDVVRKEYIGGTPVLREGFTDPIEHPITYPDVENSDNIVAQRNMTAEISGRMQSRRILKSNRLKDQSNMAEAERLQAMAFRTPEPNPNSPTMDIYLRPAFEKDIPGIAAIYNYYVEHSIVPEDQSKITDRELLDVWKNTQQDSLPFIVAVKGTMPKNGIKKSDETIVGFAFADTYFGLRGMIGGRSRFTACIKFYTHQEYLRKGIARCLLDRLLQLMSSNHGGKDGYDWMNSDNNKIYEKLAGSKRYHQILIELPIELKDDPTHTWFKNWLESRFYFKQVAHFRSTGRTAKVGAARWLDVVNFQLEACFASEFPAHI